MSVHLLCAWRPRMPEEGLRTPGTVLADAVSCCVVAGNQAGFSGRAASNLNL